VRRNTHRNLRMFPDQLVRVILPYFALLLFSCSITSNVMTIARCPRLQPLPARPPAYAVSMDHQYTLAGTHGALRLPSERRLPLGLISPSALSMNGNHQQWLSNNHISSFGTGRRPFIFLVECTSCSLSDETDLSTTVSPAHFPALPLVRSSWHGFILMPFS